jgi:hypothetical protein
VGAQVDVDDAVPVALVVAKARRADDARVGDEDVDGSELFAGQCGQGVDAVGGAGIRHRADGGAASSPDQLGGLVGAGSVQVPNDDRGAGCGEYDSEGPSDARSGACNDDDRAFDLHPVTLTIASWCTRLNATP